MMIFKKLISCIVIAGYVTVCLVAQTKNDAINLYNKGIGLMKTDISSSIDSIQLCIKTCDQVGDSAKTIKDKATQLLPDLYYQKAYKLYATDKKIPEALISAKEALKLSEQYSVEKVKEKTQKVMVLAYSALGSGFFKVNDNNNALKAFDSALQINPNYNKALFNKALVYRKLDNPTKFGETIDAFIEKAKAENDTIQVGQATKLALEYYCGAGNKADQANKLTDALTLLTQAEKYGTDKDVFYYFADVYNKQRKFDDALTHGQKGLDLEMGTAEAKAKFYYVIAVAQNGKGNKDEACASFKNAMYGPFLEASKAQATNLKCGQ